MTPALLTTFLKVMEMGSISDAAEKLHLTQPAISKRIQQLEQHLAIALFDRQNRKLIPTHAAHALYPKAKQWLIDFDEIRNAIAYDQEQVAGNLTVGTSHHIGMHHIPRTLQHYAQQYPQVNLNIKFVDSEQAHASVLSGELELAFLTLPPKGDARLKYQVLWEDELVFVAAPFHPLAQLSTLSLHDLMPYPALLPDTHTFTSKITLAVFQQAGLQPKLNMTTNPLEALRLLVSIGLGWSVLPKTLLSSDVIALPINLPITRQLGLVTNPKRTLSKAAQHLIQCVCPASVEA